MIIGDLNDKVGKGKKTDIMGKFGLGAKNEKGDLSCQ